MRDTAVTSRGSETDSRSSVVPSFDSYAEGSGGLEHLPPRQICASAGLRPAPPFGLVTRVVLAGRMTASLSSRKTAPCIWPVRPIPATSVATSFATRATTIRVASHQSSGFCSDQPGCGENRGYSAVASASTRPASSIARHRAPVVPMSSPSSAVTREYSPLPGDWWANVGVWGRHIRPASPNRTGFGWPSSWPRCRWRPTWP
jgi:hypothetical protein